MKKRRSLATDTLQTGHDRGMTSRSLVLVLGIPLAFAACVDTQELGDPQDTNGGSGGETESPTTDDPNPDDTEGDSVGETEGESVGETDGSVHDDCVELVWSCPSDDLVCLPEGLCVPCADEGESPDSAEGGHCCAGLVQNADGSECVPEPATKDCRPDGALCGYAGVTQPCCDGSVCNPDTDLCEPDGGKPIELCADYEPPKIDNCAAGGESSTSFSLEGGFEDALTDEVCTVGTPISEKNGEEVLPLDCGGDAFVLRYVSAAPHLVAPIAEDDTVLFSMSDFELNPGPQPSVSIRTMEGELLLAFVDHYELQQELPIALAEFGVSYGETGCAVSDAFGFCGEGQSVLSGEVSVQLTTDEGAVEPLQSGGNTSFDLGGRTYDVTVGDANRLVCWDKGCAGDEGGPFDHVRMLIVAQ